MHKPATYLKRNKGFTLIELLVVISIVSMLASVVIASVQGMRDKARIVSGLMFATNLYHAKGLDAIVRYTFDSDVGQPTLALDDSGSERNASCNAGIVTDTPSGSGKARSFSSSNVCDAQFEPISFGDKFMINFWLKARETGTYNFQLTPPVLVRLTSSQYANAPIQNFLIQRGKWHNLAYTFESNGNVTVYVDGKVVAQGLSQSGFPETVDRVRLFGTGVTIDDFNIYPDAEPTQFVEVPATFSVSCLSNCKAMNEEEAVQLLLTYQFAQKTECAFWLSNQDRKDGWSEYFEGNGEYSELYYGVNKEEFPDNYLNVECGGVLIKWSVESS